MRKVNTTITLDPSDKKEAMKLLKSFGLDLSTFVSIAIRQMIFEQKIPFEISAHAKCSHIPNKETLEAIKEMKDMKKHPEKYKTYKSFKELLDEIK